MRYKTFDEIITTQGVSNHCTPIVLEPGIVSLKSQTLDLFSKLYRPSGTTKNTGNGEVAIYWLYNKAYGGLYKVERIVANESSDLKIDGHKVEIKGWNQDIFSNTRIKIGKFERLHFVRRMINIVFGVYNVFYAGRYEGEGEKFGKSSYLSESSFGINGLTRAFDCALLHKSVQNVSDVVNHSMYEGLTEPIDFAAQTFVVLAREKLMKKCGSNSFIINARPDIMGRLEVFQMGDLNEIDFDIIKNEGARVQCSELFLNLRAFEKKT